MLYSNRITAILVNGGHDARRNLCDHAALDEAVLPIFGDPSRLGRPTGWPGSAALNKNSAPDLTEILRMLMCFTGGMRAV